MLNTTKSTIAANEACRDALVPSPGRESETRLQTLASIAVAILYASVLLALSPDGTGSSFHRQQASSLLGGRFDLGNTLDAMQPGLAWHGGRVQQVWGLGVGIWMVPFEALGRLLGWTGRFTEAAAKWAGFWLLAFYAGRMCTLFVRRGQAAFGIGAAWLILLCPGLWTLNRGSQLIFEETVLYAVLLSLGGLTALIRIFSFRRKSDAWAGFALAALGVWVRPTHGAFGFMLMCVATVVLWRRANCTGLLFMGLGLWLCSAALLLGTNHYRFGAPFEFGHRLTVTTESMIYLTRFGNPFNEAPFADCARELMGALFLAPNISGNWAFGADIFPGQSDFLRWRRLDTTAFDWSMAAIAATGAGLGGRRLWHAIRQHNRAGLDLQSGLLLWSCCGLVALVIFYLRYPVLTSRYLLDFAPGFAGLGMIAWGETVARWKRCASATVAAWLLFEIATTNVNPGGGASDTLLQRKAADFSSVSTEYSMNEHPVRSSVIGNGIGWDSRTGIASPIVTLVVRDPAFLAFNVSRRRSKNGMAVRADTYRIAVAGRVVHPKRVSATEAGIDVYFEMPGSAGLGGGFQYVFLCFTDGYDLEDQTSERFLQWVRWGGSEKESFTPPIR